MTSELRVLKKLSEEHAIGAVRRQLEADGLDLSDWSFPDRQEHGTRAPDAAFILNGEQCALEVVSFRISQDLSDSAAESREFVGILNAALEPTSEDPAGTLLPIVLYDPAKFLATPRRQLVKDVLGIAGSIREVLFATPDPWARHTIYPRPAWTVSVSVVRTRSEDRGTSSYFGTLGHNIQGVLGAFVDWVISKKGSQHAAYGRGILAIQRRWMEEPETLGNAFAAKNRADIPWWRVYLVEPGGDVALVWTRDVEV